MKNYNDGEILSEMRKRMFLTSYRNGTTHLASAYSCLEILWVLYSRGIVVPCDGGSSHNVEAGQADGNNKNANYGRSHLILSKGHAAIGLYAVLERLGFLNEGELDTFLKPGTRLGGEPCRGYLPSVDTSTGSLGHGLSVGVGMALAQRLKKQDESRVFVILGDGECEEGSVWEAAMSAASYGLDSFTVILDSNGLQKMDSVEGTLKRVGWAEKWRSFGWEVSGVNGHDIGALEESLKRDERNGMPHLLIANTIKGHGIPIMENDVKWHYKEFTKKDIRKICESMDISLEELD